MLLKFYGRVGNGVFVFSIPAFLTGTDEDRLLLRRYLGATAFRYFSIVYMSSVL